MKYQKAVELGLPEQWVGVLTKVCTRCKEEKPVEEFCWMKSAYNGVLYPGFCLSCSSASVAKTHKKNVDAGLCRNCGKPRENLNKALCNNCLKENAERSRKNYQPKPPRQPGRRARGVCLKCGEPIINSTSKLHCMSCLEKIRQEGLFEYHEGGGKEKRKNWYENRGGREIRQKRQKEKHREIADYYRGKRQNDINFKIANNLRGRINCAVRRNSRAGSAVRDLGCTIPELKIYLESQFHDGMSWENWGKVWHIDHIRPLSSFDLTNREQFIVACNYKNLQPLLAEENLSKGGKF